MSPKKFLISYSVKFFTKEKKIIINNALRIRIRFTFAFLRKRTTHVFTSIIVRESKHIMLKILKNMRKYGNIFQRNDQVVGGKKKISKMKQNIFGEKKIFLRKKRPLT